MSLVTGGRLSKILPTRLIRIRNRISCGMNPCPYSEDRKDCSADYPSLWGHSIMIWNNGMEHASSDTAKDSLQVAINTKSSPSIHRRTNKLSFIITTSISRNFTRNLFKMQLLSFSFVLLAALGAQALPAKEGTVGLLALGVCIMSLMSIFGHHANQSPPL